MATLVTGAFGCIGAWVCKRLLEAGEKSVAFDVGDDPWRMRMILGPERLRGLVMVKGDIARACIAASTTTLEGARVYNLHGESATFVDLARLIEEAWPAAKGTITHVQQPISFPSELADPGYQRDLGPAPRTAIRDGIRKTLDEFAALQKAGRLDARELEPAR